MNGSGFFLKRACCPTPGLAGGGKPGYTASMHAAAQEGEEAITAALLAAGARATRVPGGGGALAHLCAQSSRSTWPRPPRGRSAGRWPLGQTSIVVITLYTNCMNAAMHKSKSRVLGSSEESVCAETWTSHSSAAWALGMYTEVVCTAVWFSCKMQGRPDDSMTMHPGAPLCPG
jgi:hypothetical protein